MGENNKLIENINNLLKDKVVEALTNRELMGGGSAYLTFIGKYINGFYLIQLGCDDIIYTLDDNIDKVDIKYIEKLSTAISDFIIKNSGKVYKLQRIIDFRRRRYLKQ